MKLLVLSVRDKVAGVYGQPFLSTSVGQSIRQFTDEVNRAAEDNVLFKHPDDHELYKLGSFDNELGTYDLLAQPELLARGELVKVVKTVI